MRVATIAPLVLLVLLALSPAVLAAAPPPGTAILVVIDDLEGIAASFKGSAAHRLYQEAPAVRKAVDGALGALGKTVEMHVEQIRRFVGFSLKDRDEVLAAPGLLRGRASLALVPADGGEIRFLLHYRAKTDEEARALHSALAILEAGVLRADPATRIDLEEGISVLRTMEEETRLAWCFEGRDLVIGQDPETVRLSRKATDEGPWTAPLARAVAAADGAPGLRLWADVGRLARHAEAGAFDEGFRNLVRVLETIGIRGVACASAFTRSGGVDVIHLVAPQDSLLARFAKDSAEAPRPASTPAGTLFSLTSGASPEDLLATWMEILERSDPHAFAVAQQGMENLVLGLGIDAREDLLAKLGEGVSVHFIATGKGLEPLATAPVRDHDALLFTVEQVGEAAQWRRTVREDGTLWIAAGEGKAKGPTGFLLRKDRLWIGKPAALAALNEKPTSAIDATLTELIPEGARMLMTARHSTLVGVLGKALAGKHPGLAKLLGGEALTGRPGGEAIALVPAKGGATLIHVSTLAPAGTWLAVAAALSIK